MKTVSKILLLLVGVFSMYSCQDFLDVNTNPNTPESSTPEYTLPIAQQELVSLNGTTMVTLGQYMVYNWAVPSNWSAMGDELRYNVTSNFYTSIWSSSYAGSLKNLTYVDTYEDGLVDYGIYKSISSTLKGFQYQLLVDLYGDIPYSEANQRVENLTPAYDNAQDVYVALVERLTQVPITLANLPSNAQNPGDQDIIFKGDVTKWAQFANTVKLRLLVRMSNLTDKQQYIRDEIAKIDANGYGYITADVSANPGYSKTAGKQSPFYGYIGKTFAGRDVNRYKWTVATDYTVDYLKGINDPRLNEIYSTVGGDVKGVKQSTSLPGSGFTTSDLSHTGPGLLKGDDQDQPLMLLSEALFLQAEAAQRGYTSGDAKQLYNNAVQASFDYLGSGSATSYLGQGLPNVTWDNSSDKIQAIITQKWIALNGVSSIESWIEKTRTGFPAGLPVAEESNGVRPVRLLYPSSEISSNSQNVPEQTSANAFNQPPFWK